MSKFNDLINKYLNQNELAMSGMDFGNTDYCELNPLIMENLFFEAINENEFTELASIPKPFLNYVCSKIRTKNNSKFIITYEEIFELLKNYNYKDIYDFKLALNYLKSFDSGYLCIGVCNYNFNEFKEIFLSNEMNENRLNLFYSICADEHSGDTFSGDPVLRAKYKNACIWLNKSFIIPYSTWKDTLSHELSHFIQRVVVFQRTTYTGKIEKSLIQFGNAWYSEISLNPNINLKFYQIFDKLLSNYSPDILQKLISLYKGTIFNREESTVIQNIMNGFQRIYEQQNMINGKPNYKKLETNHNANLYKNQRLNFLNNLLNKINDINFFNTIKGQNVINHLLNFNNQKIKSIYSYQKEFKDSIYILQYLCIKNIMPEWNIDDKLKRHFEIFKFRDN